MTRRAFLCVVFVALSVGFAAPPADGCTTFLLNDGVRFVFGKNYDWMIRSGMLVVNQRGVAKISIADQGGNPARWVSRYGSVTFNQFGREFPMGGMNEVGLVVELMWLEGTVYPPADDRATLDNLQWIQYQLDTAATVDDVIASNERVRIVDGAPLHYLVADARGNAATIEFLDGRLVAHTGPTLPVAALTNSTYASSLAYFERWPDGWGSTSSLDRFVGAANSTLAFAERPPANASAHAFDTLSDVSQPGYTRWSIVYEIAEHQIHFRTNLLPTIRSLGLTELDFACGGEVWVLGLGTRVSGDILDDLVPYTFERNLSLIEYAYRNVPFLQGTPQSVIDEIARYPETTTCVGLARVRRPSGRVGHRP
jgi:choloylglycine hydrolase